MGPPALQDHIHLGEVGGLYYRWPLYSKTGLQGTLRGIISQNDMPPWWSDDALRHHPVNSGWWLEASFGHHQIRHNGNDDNAVFIPLYAKEWDFSSKIRKLSIFRLILARFTSFFSIWSSAKKERVDRKCTLIVLRFWPQVVLSSQCPLKLCFTVYV